MSEELKTPQFPTMLRKMWSGSEVQAWIDENWNRPIRKGDTDMKPSSGRMYWWRAKGAVEWRFGYCTHESQGLVRMGRWNGDTTGGAVISPFDIEWKDYQ